VELSGKALCGGWELERRYEYGKTSTYKVQSPSVVLAPSAKVCELIERKTRWWNISLLEQIFFSFFFFLS
jgi:hypothetical protein